MASLLLLLLLHFIQFFFFPSLVASFSSSSIGGAARNHHIKSTPHHDDDDDDVLWKMIRFFGIDMVDTRTNRFYYHCYPIDGECKHVHMPIRDLAAAWDATKALEFVNNHYMNASNNDNDVMMLQQQLTDAIKCTLSAYQSNLQINGLDKGKYLHKDAIVEASTIGHSALLLLGICDACKISILKHDDESIIHDIEGLVQGILSQQLENGAFNIEFGSNNNNYLRGIEFYPGEAMLSLMHAQQYVEMSTQQSILRAMEQAFAFYSSYYYNDEEIDVNYNIWQVLAFAKYYDALVDNNNNDDQSKRVEEVQRYVLDMCQEICQSRSWKYQLSRGQSFYPNVEVVEIVCGLDALAEGIRIAQDLLGEEDTTTMFKMHAKRALYFIEWAQSQVSDDCLVGKGGLGYGGVQVFEQRLDITGHAISALIKLRNLSVLLPS